MLVSRKDEKKVPSVRSNNSTQENALLDIAQKRFKDAKTEKTDFRNKPLHDNWKRYDQIYRGKQWFQPVAPDRSMPVLNFTRSIVDSLVPRLSSNQPKVLVRPRMSPEDGRLAELVGSALDYLWYWNQMQESTLREVITQMLKYGTSIIKTTWDPTVWDGVGEVRYSCVHPMNFFNDPRAYRITDMEYCFVRTPKPLEYFLRNYPNKGHLVVADHDWWEVEDLEGRGETGNEEQATLTEYWFKDTNGIVSVMYYSGDVVLDIMGGEYDSNPELKELPVYGHNKFPFTKVCDYNNDKEFWGTGEIELVEVLQNLINAYEAQIIDNTRLMGNAQWVVNKALSGLSEEDAWIFDNTPGRVVFTHNDGVRREPGVPIPHHIPEHLERLIHWLEQITGVFDVVQGRRPVGVRAASAIIALQEAASIRVQEKAENLGSAIRDISEQAITLMLEHYDEPRMVRIAGDDVPTTLDVRAALEERVVDMAKAAGMEQVFEMEQEISPEDQQALMDEIMEEIKFPEFDISIDVGPSIPYSQALLYEQAKEFYSLGIIDREAVLEVTGFPNKEEILARLGAMEEQAEEERIGERTF